MSIKRAHNIGDVVFLAEKSRQVTPWFYMVVMSPSASVDGVHVPAQSVHVGMTREDLQNLWRFLMELEDIA